MNAYKDEKHRVSTVLVDYVCNSKGSCRIKHQFSKMPRADKVELQPLSPSESILGDQHYTSRGTVASAVAKLVPTPNEDSVPTCRK